MKITRLEAVPFTLPVRRDFRWTGLSAGIGSFVLVRVHTDDGLIGLGEATPLAEWGGDFGTYSGETQATVSHIVEDLLAAVVEGCDPTNIERLVRLMDKAVRGHSYAKAAVDVALHDLLGKIAGVPLYQLLGGANEDGVAVAHMVGLMGLDDAVDEAKGAVADGVAALQVKAGADGQRDVALVHALRAELGPDVLLRIDANQGYGEIKSAVRAIREMEAAGLDYIEQPVAGLRRMSEVRAAVSVPVVADESCWSPWDTLECYERQAADAVSIYLAKAGGISRARKVAAIAETAGYLCDVNGSIESGVGNAANLHFALATTAVRLPCVIPFSAPAGTAPYKTAGHYYEDDIITDPLPVQNGVLLPTSGPGLGVEVDEEKLERFRAG
jgi:L-alanine-DL-glutamate epimerase-like enolase superfamily enzyme